MAESTAHDVGESRIGRVWLSGVTLNEAGEPCDYSEKRYYDGLKQAAFRLGFSIAWEDGEWNSPAGPIPMREVYAVPNPPPNTAERLP